MGKGDAIALAKEAAAGTANHQLDGVEVAALRKHYALDTILALAEIGHVKQASEEWAYQQGRASPAAKAPLMAITGKLQLNGQNAILENVSPSNYPRPAAFHAAQNSSDPALLYAIIKQESGFNTQATSHRGARGAMQLMPDTANYLLQKMGKQPRSNLSNTATNIALGQAYLKVLGTQPHIGNNLVYMLSAYNAGPTILGKWLRERPVQEDPLLFIESIPYTETRSYVSQVLKNYWVYRSLMHQNEQPALPQMLTGEWPRYAALEPQKVASLR
jgi:soluble lytic murein transglycosylase-like protein